jgi:mannonate dehydratase
MCGPDGPETQAALAANIQRFTATGRVNFVHLRDVRGDATHFVETFHDEGPTNLASMLRLYHKEGFRGPVRCDHVPTLAGETNANPGYGTLGRLFANGYLLGLMDALGVRTDPAEWLKAR